MAHLTSNPYPAGQPQPDTFIVTLDGGTPVESPAQKNADGSTQLYFQLPAGLPAGQHVAIIAAESKSDPLWLESAPVNFPFTSATLSTPSGLTVVL